jgi:spartin
MISPTEAFLLLTLPNAHLSTPTTNQSGTLALECVTVTLPPSGNDPGSPPSHQDVYLVLRLNNFETPIDPTRVVEICVIENGTRTYRFCGTNTDPTVLVLSITPPVDNHLFFEDLETFEGIIAQYAELREASPATGISHNAHTADLRGHLVLINEDNGEIVGEVERSFRINEDPSLYEKGRENEPIVIEVPEGAEDELKGTPIEVFARNIPPGEENWITKGATVVRFVHLSSMFEMLTGQSRCSHVISTTTDLFLTGITSASTQYIENSKSSPLNASNSSRTPSNNPAPRNEVMFLKGLSTVQAISGEAVQLSSKTVSMIDAMIKRAVGGKKKDKQRAYVLGNTPTPHLLTPQAGAKPPLPPRTSSPIPQLGPSLVPPPPYSRSPSALPAPLPPPTASNNALPPLPPRKLGTKAKIFLSADLILSTLDDSATKVLDVSSQRLAAVVGHK